MTFMNHSGRAVRAFTKKKSIPAARILVIHDELDFAIGKLRFKCGGGEGGHKGLLSISQLLGSRDYWRLRVGIGRPAVKDDVTDYVLSRPGPDERAVYAGLVTMVLAGLAEFVFGDQQAAMRALHQT